MGKLQELYEGWKNLLVPESELKPYVEKVSRERTEICVACDHHSDNASLGHIGRVRFDKHCTRCGCTLSAKTRGLTSSCPIGKWKEAVIDG